MEEVLFEFHPCHVFRLPLTGYLSSALWEGGHIWSGKVKLVRTYTEDGVMPSHAVHLLEVDSDTVFAVCPLKDDLRNGNSFQVANDSSRCFVLRVEQGDQHAYLGVNFEEKADAFRFCTAVVERNKRLHLLVHPQEDAIARYAGTHSSELRAEGKIEIDLNGKLTTPVSGSSTTATTTSGSAFSLENIPRAHAGNRRVRQVVPATSQEAPSNSRPLAQPPAAAKPSSSSHVGESAAARVPSAQCPDLLDPFASPPPRPATTTPLVDPFAGLESLPKRPDAKANNTLDAFF